MDICFGAERVQVGLEGWSLGVWGLTLQARIPDANGVFQLSESGFGLHLFEDFGAIASRVVWWRMLRHHDAGLCSGFGGLLLGLGFGA